MVDLLQFVINVVSLGGLYAMLALGLSLVFSVLGLINFAYGELIMIAGYSALFLGAGGLPLWLIVLLTVLIVALASVLTERIAFRPVRGAEAATLLITSFAVSFVLKNLASLFISPRPRGLAIPSALTQTISIGALRVPPLEAVTVVTSLLVLGALTLFLRRTTIGVQLRAAAEDLQMARMLGVRVNRVITAAFAVSGVLAAIAGLLWLARTANVSPNAGFGPLLVAFIAIVIGGLGSLRGAVLGGLVYAALIVGLQSLLPTGLLAFRNAFAFGIVIVLLLLRPRGLLGTRVTESV